MARSVCFPRVLCGAAAAAAAALFVLIVQSLGAQSGFVFDLHPRTPLPLWTEKKMHSLGHNHGPPASKRARGGRPLKCAHSIVKNQDTSWAWKTQVGTSCSPTQVCGLAREGPAAMRSPPLQQSWPCVATQTAAWKQLSHLGKFAEASLWHRVDLCGLELIIDWEPERPPGLSPWKSHQHRSSRCRLLGDCR